MTRFLRSQVQSRQAVVRAEMASNGGKSGIKPAAIGNDLFNALVLANELEDGTKLKLDDSELVRLNLTPTR